MPHYEIAPTDIVVEYTAIPVQVGEPFYEQIVSIDGTTYTFTFRWDDDANYWYLDVADEAGDPINMGIRLVLGITLGRTSTHRLFRTGVMMLFDTSDSGVDPTLSDLGTRVELRRFTTDQYYAAFGIARKFVAS